jgi:hypothetical protein
MNVAAQRQCAATLIVSGGQFITANRIGGFRLSQKPLSTKKTSKIIHGRLQI